MIRTEGWEKAVKKPVLPWECLITADSWLWRKMGKKRTFPTENYIVKIKAELGAGDFDSGVV